MDFTEDEGVRTEPVYYSPIIPTLLVNGSKAIATGYSTSVPQFHPLQLIANVRRRLTGGAPAELKPFYRGFKGDIVPDGDGNFTTHGIFEVDGNDVTITELPVGTWSSNYKKFLESMYEKKDILNYSEGCTDVDVSFVVTLKGGSVSSETEKFLRLTSTIRCSNMHAFDANGQIKLYKDAAGIEEAHFEARKKTYDKRKANMIEVLQHEVKLIREKVRFMDLKLTGKIKIDNVGLGDIMRAIEANDFEKLGATVCSTSASFDYITAIKLFDFTAEKVDTLKSACDGKKEELRKLKGSTIKELWFADLDALEGAIKEIY